MPLVHAGGSASTSRAPEVRREVWARKFTAKFHGTAKGHFGVSRIDRKKNRQ